MTHGASSPRAFTLIELVVVMLCLAIMSGVVASSMGGVPRQREATAARQMERDLGFARQRAVSTGLRTWIVFSPPSDIYTVLTESLTTPGLANAITLTDPATTGPFIVRLGVDAYAGVDMTAAAFDGAASIGFDYLGRPLSSGATSLVADGSVTLSGGSVVRVAAGTGRISCTTP